MALPEVTKDWDLVMDDVHERLFRLRYSVLIMASYDQA